MNRDDKIINGKELSKKFLQKTKEQIRELGINPGLAAILIGNDSASHLYVKLKKHACNDCDINFHQYLFEGDYTEKEIIDCIKFLNNDPETTGILIQLPLPPKYNTERIIKALDYRKDIDGFHPKNHEKMQKCEYRLLPPLPLAIVELVNSTGQEIKNKEIVILCNHLLFAAPFSCVWGKDNKVKAKTLEDKKWQTAVKKADVLIVAIGKPLFINTDMIKKDATIIDVGINKLGDKIVGDVDYNSVLNKVKFITPVPGGVGPMTIAMLLRNLVQLHLMKKNS